MKPRFNWTNFFLGKTNDRFSYPNREDKMSIKKWIIPCLLAAMVFAFSVSPVSAAYNADYFNPIAKTMGSPTRALLNINLLSYWILSDGIAANSPVSLGSGVFFPRGTYNAGVIYIEGLLWGGMVNDGQTPTLRVGGSAYLSGLMRGAIKSRGVAEDPEAPDVRMWRIRPDYETADLRQDAAEQEETGLTAVTDADIEAVREQYATDWEEWPWQKGAPFYDVNGNGRLDWDYEEDLNGNGRIETGEREEPGYAGADQVVWFVTNDLDDNQARSFYGSPSVGLECQITLWGYNRTDALGNVVFKKYRVIYKGTEFTPNDASIDSMFFAVFNDPDCGEYGDDFMGCDTTLGMMFVYNSVTQDAKFADYGLAPPAAGYDFLQGPVVDGDTLGMSAFSYFAAGSAIDDPDQKEYAGTEQWYNLMNGLKPRAGTPFTDNAGNPTKYPLAGDPVTNTGDNDGVQLPAGDRRGQMITGPISMALGDTQDVVVALVAGMGADRLSSVSVMKYNDISAQYAYDSDFELAKAPAPPSVQVTTLDQQIILNWGFDDASVKATEAVDQKGYLFEGYNVYEFPSSASTLDEAKLLATYDVSNEVTTILDASFDETSGQILELPVQLGTNSGVKRKFSIEKSAFTGKPLVNGTSYYFAVTAYSYNGDDAVPIHSLESSPAIKTAIPQDPNPGTRYSHEIGDTITVTHHGTSDGSCAVYVVDPTKTTGHKYAVVFDTLNGGSVWHLYDSTAAEFVMMNQTNQSGDDDYLLVDGVQVVVEGPSAGFHGMWQVANANGPIAGCDEDVNENIMWINFLTAPDYPTQQAQGGWWFVTHGGGTANDYGSFLERVLRDDNPSRAIPNDFEMRFTEEGGVAWFAYTTGSVQEVPFELWNIGFDSWDDPSDDFRMLPLVYDINEDEIFNYPFDDPSSSSGDDPGSDWIYWYNPEDTSPGETGYDGFFFGDLGYGGEVFARTRLMNWNGYGGCGDIFGDAVLLDSVALSTLSPEVGTVIRWVTNKPNAMGADVYSFSTEAPTYETETAKSDVEKISVYPNPYYGMNPREQTGVDRFVSFNHLPEKATFRIFDLAGTLVDKFEKDDETQFIRWDLRNHNELPVASGIYIVHIEMPDLGKVKILKLAVVREAEFIEFF